MKLEINQNRIFKLKNGSQNEGKVLYWMSREQRVSDNWSLIAAYNESIERKTELFVVFTLVDNFLGATRRHFGFMLKGLKEVSESLQKLNIHFKLLTGNPPDILPEFINSNNFSVVFTDFDPLRIKREWKKSVADKINATMYEVDSHNIVPCRLASEKLEFAAYTIRPKINKKLSEYLTDFPLLPDHPFNLDVNNIFPVIELSKYNEIPAETKYFNSGENEAISVMNRFFNSRFNDYDEKRNFPELNLQSDLSPYLHFGQISSQRIAFNAGKQNINLLSKNAFLEELIIRKELSDNFCFYNPNYDKFEGFHEWAQKTLIEHLKDKRNYLYSIDEFEQAKTHDKYWNAAQNEMLKTGKMHGYIRMYWAKKILEWSESPMQALEIAIYLNDKYSLDGRDPNGYTGIAWSIGGIHDRAWTERPIFGKIRFMNDGGLKRKFDIEKYVSRINQMKY
jgi:deoxyribodipyrimidine photo-lyase